MSQIASTTAYDGAATPANHTFQPVDVSREGKKDLATWRESLTTVPVYAQIRTVLSLEILKSGIYAVSRRTVVPSMESVSGQNSAGYTAPPKVAFEDTLVTTGYFSPRSTEASRKLAYQLHLNLLGNVTISVTPPASGYDADLFHRLFMPT